MTPGKNDETHCDLYRSCLRYSLLPSIPSTFPSSWAYGELRVGTVSVVEKRALASTGDTHEETHVCPVVASLGR